MLLQRGGPPFPALLAWGWMGGGSGPIQTVAFPVVESWFGGSEGRRRYIGVMMLTLTPR